MTTVPGTVIALDMESIQICSVNKYVQHDTEYIKNMTETGLRKINKIELNSSLNCKKKRN